MRLDIPLARYQMTVMDNPRKPGEGFTDYITRIAEIATAVHLAAPLKPMPDVRLPYREAE